jgi:aminocarboxymuconate-semialdehyde decarboxylase
MRIDAYTHFIPKKFYDEVIVKGGHADIGKRMRGIPAIYDLNVRKKVVDKFKDYAQIVSYSMPAPEIMASNPNQVEEYCKISNDGFGEMCSKNSDHFPRLGRTGTDGAPDPGARECARAFKNAPAAYRSIPTSPANRSTIRSSPHSGKR